MSLCYEHTDAQLRKLTGPTIAMSFICRT